MRHIPFAPVKNLARRTTLFATLAIALVGCASVPTPVSVADTIAANPSLSTLNGLVVQAGLTDTLRGAGPFTVFAPSNDAFKAVPAKTLESLGKDPAALKAVLTYHVLPAKAMAADVKNGKAKTVNGAELELSKAGDFVTVESAMVGKADIAASNGVVHIIDAVLMPPVKK
ncbi:MAG: fasciclin domain-containing protein [Rhodoferax sp.]|nr:fasciclin domain-containing protein [Rhodoferax sp.]